MGRKCFVSLTAAAQGAELRKSPAGPLAGEPAPCRGPQHGADPFRAVWP